MSSGGRNILVWDAPTRLFHWLTVALVVAAYVTWRLNWMDGAAFLASAMALSSSS
jgi:cytochrome b